MLTPKQLADLAAKSRAEKAAAEQAAANQTDLAASTYIADEYAKAIAKIPAILEKAARDGNSEAVAYSWEVVGYSRHSKEDAIVGERLKAHLEEQGFTVRTRNFEKLAPAVGRMHKFAELIASW